MTLLVLSLYEAHKITKIEHQRAMNLRDTQQKENVLKAEKEIIKLNNEKLEHELVHKTKELTSSALHIVHNIETIQNLSSKEIAPLLSLSLRGIEASRYRLRRKMNLPQETNLTEFIIRY